MNQIKNERSIGEFTRSSDEGKIDYSLIPQEFLDELAALYTEGALVHGRNNWMKGTSDKAVESFEASATRHFFDWLRQRNRTEKHRSQVVFNMNGRDNALNKLNE